MAQSAPKSNARPADSLAITRDFIRNARPILDNLTALHYARLETRVLRELVTRHEQERDQLAKGYIDAQHQSSQDQLVLQQQLVDERKKGLSGETLVWERWRAT